MPRVSDQISCENPKVSVGMITYNHEKFIAEAIESVLMQETDFRVELIIGEDCSTDGTRQIVKAYAEKYPNVIRALLPERNVGMQRNSAAVLAACRGEYVACLEGDDFWTSPDKLALQINLLDQNPDCALCHHRVVYFRSNLENVIEEFPAPDKRFARATGEMLARGNFIQTCSLVFRRSAMPHLNEEFMKLQLGDFPLCVMLAQHGWIGYIDRNMAAYRLHDTSFWSAQSEAYKSQAGVDMVRFLVNTLTKQHRGPWAIRFLDYEAEKLLMQSRSESLPVIARAGFDLIRNGLRLRIRKVPKLLGCVAKALAHSLRRKFASR